MTNSSRTALGECKTAVDKNALREALTATSDGLDKTNSPLYDQTNPDTAQSMRATR